MTGTTSQGLPFPDDYTKPADSPNAFQALAAAVDAELVERVMKTGDTMTGRLELRGPGVLLLHQPGVAAALLEAYLSPGGRQGARVMALDYTAVLPLAVAPATEGEHVVTLAQVSGKPNMEPPGFAGGWPAANGSMRVAVWDVGSLAAGEVKQGQNGIIDGTYIFVSVQHPSTHLIANANITAPDTVQFNIRNSGTAALTNVKCHLLFINP